MLTAQDLKGIMAMMPAFATPDAADINATNTVAVDNLKTAVDKLINDDGAQVISTTGSFGEFHTLLWPEFETITRATVEAVNKRVPLFIGCTALNSREVVQRMRVARDAGADGVLLGVPFYFPATVDNAVRFYHDVGELFPDLAIMIYHNPVLHNITIPVSAFNRILENPRVVAMKDSHRDPRQMMQLLKIADGRLSVFVNWAQAYPFMEIGAAGFWSYDVWMGPWPMVALRNAVQRGDVATARDIILDVSRNNIGGGGVPPLAWRETASKLAIANAGYCEPGPLRPPFVEIPAEVRERAEKFAAFWQELNARYRPHVEAGALARA
ncbi:MAG TPA: dihydrodipicolinate synthase family protein [Chloroflexota bacterium]